MHGRNSVALRLEDVLSKSALLGVLLLAAILEAGGDALVRHGLHGQSWVTRVGFMSLGALVLFAYAISVNAPPWDFGRLLGVYVTLFFVVAQLINWFAFGVPPTLAIIVGGGFIVAGGLIITGWR
jgi:small multidrug resistance family-3 protein